MCHIHFLKKPALVCSFEFVYVQVYCSFISLLDEDLCSVNACNSKAYPNYYIVIELLKVTIVRICNEVCNHFFG